MQDASYVTRGYTVTVSKQPGGTRISTATTPDENAARLYVLENGLPWNTTLGDALRLSDRVLAGERVVAGGLVVEAVRRGA